LDINAAAQQMVVQIITETIEVSGVGRPTLTFVNYILRNNPAALREYETCRTSACARPNVDQQRREVARCAAQIIGRYTPTELLPALLPARVYFDFDSNTLRADAQEKINLIAQYLMAHPNTSVHLEGHTDPVGSASYNMGLGQRRADAVAQRLIDQGVDFRQVVSVTSRGEEMRLSTGRSSHWMDRRVEIIPMSRALGP
jgi:outer membrane protein OmpA-like peptidoglycan-associated protein